MNGRKIHIDGILTTTEANLNYPCKNIADLSDPLTSLLPPYDVIITDVCGLRESLLAQFEIDLKSEENTSKLEIRKKLEGTSIAKSTFLQFLCTRYLLQRFRILCNPA